MPLAMAGWPAGTLAVARGVTEALIGNLGQIKGLQRTDGDG